MAEDKVDGSLDVAAAVVVAASGVEEGVVIADECTMVECCLVCCYCCCYCFSLAQSRWSCVLFKFKFKCNIHFSFSYFLLIMHSSLLYTINRYIFREREGERDLESDTKCNKIVRINRESGRFIVIR